MYNTMDEATTCMKVVIFTFNLFLWILGGVLLGIGVWVRSDSDFYEYHESLNITQYYQACYVAIVAGAIILLIAFMGCCGAAMNSPCALFFYCAAMGMILIFELAVAGLVWKHGDGEKFQVFLTDSIKEQIEMSKTNDKSLRFVELLQLHLECCGGYDKDDFFMDDIPPSCSNPRTNNIYIHGCGENIRRYLEQKAGLIGGLSLGIVLIQIIALIFAVSLLMTLLEDSRQQPLIPKRYY